MISIDTNVLFHAFNVDSPLHRKAYDWLVSISGDESLGHFRVAHSRVNQKSFTSRSVLFESELASALRF